MPRAPASDRPPELDSLLLAKAQRILPRRDPRLAAVMRRAGPCGLGARRDPYIQLLRSVLYQQLAGAAARSIDRRLKERFGGRYPKPADLQSAHPATLRAAGLSRQKIKALRDIGRAFAERDVTRQGLKRLDDEAVVASVTQIHGVGEWTAHMLLMFGLARPDVLPVGDYGIQKGAQIVYGLKALPKRAELEEIARPWAPYRSVASWYLWRAAETVTPGDA